MFSTNTRYSDWDGPEDPASTLRFEDAFLLNAPSAPCTSERSLSWTWADGADSSSLILDETPETFYPALPDDHPWSVPELPEGNSQYRQKDGASALNPSLPLDVSCCWGELYGHECEGSGKYHRPVPEAYKRITWCVGYSPLLIVADPETALPTGPSCPTRFQYFPGDQQRYESHQPLPPPQQTGCPSPAHRPSVNPLNYRR